MTDGAKSKQGGPEYKIYLMSVTEFYACCGVRGFTQLNGDRYSKYVGKTLNFHRNLSVYPRETNVLLEQVESRLDESTFSDPEEEANRVATLLGDPEIPITNDHRLGFPLYYETKDGRKPFL